LIFESILSNKFALNLRQMKKTLLSVFLIAAGISVNAQTARVQVIHNSADLIADSVDVYLGTTLLLDNFAFRTATPFIDAPAGVPITIGVAPKNSTSNADAVYTTTVTLDDTKKYILIANGLVSTTGYSPASTAVPFRLSVYDMALETSATAGNTSLLVMHGCTDAPTVDVKAGATTLVNDVAFGEFCSTGYLDLPESDYVIDVTTSDGATIVKRYSAPLTTLNLGDSAITVVASGFLNPTMNSSGPAFGLWVALAKGGALIALPEQPLPASVADALSNSAVKVYPNPVNDIVNFESDKIVREAALIDFSGRIISRVAGVKKGIFEMGDLAAGIYLLRVTNEDGSVKLVRLTK